MFESLHPLKFSHPFTTQYLNFGIFNTIGVLSERAKSKIRFERLSHLHGGQIFLYVLCIKYTYNSYFAISIVSMSPSCLYTTLDRY